MIPPPHAIALSGINKRFGRTIALDGARMAVPRGTVHALLGENGAGKSTLMRVAFGMERPDTGRIEIEGVHRVLRRTADAIALGVGMVHQHFTSVPAMTVAENVALGRHGRYHAGEAAAHVRRLGDESGLQLDPSSVVEDLSIGAQQRLEIVKALSRDARILILDEPTAVLAPAEALELLRWVRAFASDDRCVILITHKLSEALSVADDITVLRRGRTVLEARAGTLTSSEVARAMLGEAVGEGRSTPTARSEPGSVSIRAANLTLRDSRGVTTLRNATFEVRAGEIVGIVAVEGAGQHELLRALARRHPVGEGTLDLPDTIGFVPEDRHRDAMAVDFDLVENVALRNASAHRGLMAWPRWRSRTESIMQEFDVRAESARARAYTLSGGNQQRLVLGRELADAPAALVVENPTRGLDIRATAAVHQRLRDASAAGTTVIVHSSDIDEVLALAHRLFALHAGTLREVDVDRELAGRAMLGLT